MAAKTWTISTFENKNSLNWTIKKKKIKNPLTGHIIKKKPWLFKSNETIMKIKTRQRNNLNQKQTLVWLF